MIQARHRSEDAHRPVPYRSVNANTGKAAGNFCTVVDAWNTHFIVCFEARVVLIFVKVETCETSTQLPQKRCPERVRIVHGKQLILRVGRGRITAADGRTTGHYAKHAGALQV